MLMVFYFISILELRAAFAIMTATLTLLLSQPPAIADTAEGVAACGYC